ncbi:MAG: alkaline phosphatase family protein, partial [Acidimicrobiales bacterium]
MESAQPATWWPGERRAPLHRPLPVLPDYGGACLDGLVPALLDRVDRPAWLPEVVSHATQVVLLVLDGLGWEQLQARAQLAPTLVSMAGGPITSVAPTTTATALTSLTLGMTPATHGMVGYRVAVSPHEVLNLLRWRTGSGDARSRIPPHVFQPEPAFCGVSVPVVTRAEFAGSGFTMAHLGGARLCGWRVPS